MCLADQIGQNPAVVDIERADGLWKMPGSSVFVPLVEEADARYVLLQDVTEACRRFSTEWNDLLAPSNPKMRAPLESFWVEWSDLDTRQQVGALFNSTLNGRSGSLRLFWKGEAGVEAAQGQILFDFDRPITSRSRDELLLFSFECLPSHLQSLKPHLGLAFDDWWVRYFRTSPLGPSTLQKAGRECTESLWRDAIHALAFIALLGIRVPLEKRSIDRSKLNVARSKSGKPRLLDHVELTIGVPEGGRASSDRKQGGVRRNPRLHVVRGHLVRRRDRVFWRSAHMRGLQGEGPSMPKTRFVRMRSN